MRYRFPWSTCLEAGEPGTFFGRFSLVSIIIYLLSISSVHAEPRNHLQEFMVVPKALSIACTSDSSLVFISKSSGDILSYKKRHDHLLSLVSTFSTGGKNPVLVASPNSQTLYAGLYLPNNTFVIDVISTATFTLVKQLTLGSSGVVTVGDIVVTPDGKQLWVCAGNHIYIVDTETYSVSRSPIDVGGNAFGLVFTPDGSQAYVCHARTQAEISYLALIDTASQTVIDSDVASRALHANGRLGPRFLVMNPDGTQLNVLTSSPASGGTVVAIETGTGKVRSIYDANDPSVALLSASITPDGKFLYVGYSTGTLCLGPTYGKECGPSVETSGLSVTSITIPPDGQFAYLVVASGAVLVIDISERPVP